MIQSWDEKRKWASENSWSFDAFCDRVSLCTSLKGTELKRLTRKIKNREINEIEVIDKETANPLIHTLESLGAKVAFK